MKVSRGPLLPSVPIWYSLGSVVASLPPFCSGWQGTTSTVESAHTAAWITGVTRLLSLQDRSCLLCLRLFPGSFIPCTHWLKPGLPSLCLHFPDTANLNLLLPVNLPCGPIISWTPSLRTLPPSDMVQMITIPASPLNPHVAPSFLFSWVEHHPPLTCISLLIASETSSAFSLLSQLWRAWHTWWYWNSARPFHPWVYPWIRSYGNL